MTKKVVSSLAINDGRDSLKLLITVLLQDENKQAGLVDCPVGNSGITTNVVPLGVHRITVRYEVHKEPQTGVYQATVRHQAHPTSTPASYSCQLMHQLQLLLKPLTLMRPLPVLQAPQPHASSTAVTHASATTVELSSPHDVTAPQTSRTKEE